MPFSNAATQQEWIWPRRGTRSTKKTGGKVFVPLVLLCGYLSVVEPVKGRSRRNAEWQEVWEKGTKTPCGKLDDFFCDKSLKRRADTRVAVKAIQTANAQQMMQQATVALNK
jgi:hypothetical protein